MEVGSVQMAIRGVSLRGRAGAMAGVLVRAESRAVANHRLRWRRRLRLRPATAAGSIGCVEAVAVAAGVAAAVVVVVVAAAVAAAAEEAVNAGLLLLSRHRRDLRGCVESNNTLVQQQAVRI